MCIRYYPVLKYHCRVFPDWLPFHPHRWWIHTRTVYVPMSYLYGIRYKMEENNLVLSLREVRYTVHHPELGVTRSHP